MNAIRRAAATAALLMILALAAVAQTTGQIRGAVVDDDGNPLAGVKVQATSSSAGTRSFTTGKDGNFRFVTLPPGSYTVSFTRADYADVQKSAVVRLDGTVTLNAKMFRLSG
jgi:uncharacterized protein (DUF2141 family)